MLTEAMERDAIVPSATFESLLELTTLDCEKKKISFFLPLPREIRVNGYGRQARTFGVWFGSVLYFRFLVLKIRICFDI